MLSDINGDQFTDVIRVLHREEKVNFDDELDIFIDGTYKVNIKQYLDEISQD